MDEGWYPDPEREGMERWWDGLAWAEFRRHANSPTTRTLGHRRLARVGGRPLLARVFDARALRERGFASVPSPLWSLATPISYLARRARVDGADRGPLLIHLVLLAASFFGILLGISLGISHLAM